MKDPKNFINASIKNILLAHLFTGVPAVAYLLILGKEAGGFAAGFLIGAGNILVALWIGSKGLEVVERGGNIQGFAISRYFLKFFLLLVFSAFVLKYSGFDPFSILIGFTVSLVLSVGVLYFALKSDQGTEGVAGQGNDKEG